MGLAVLTAFQEYGACRYPGMKNWSTSHEGGVRCRMLSFSNSVKRLSMHCELPDDGWLTLPIAWSSPCRLLRPDTIPDDGNGQRK
jgi:hypothetical protein